MSDAGRIDGETIPRLSSRDPAFVVTRGDGIKPAAPETLP
jgi:hypothetical protein